MCIGSVTWSMKDVYFCAHYMANSPHPTAVICLAMFTALYILPNMFYITCSDTVSRSGMFCATATAIDQCKTEGVVDVFQVVKVLRLQKPGAVTTVVSSV